MSGYILSKGGMRVSLNSVLLRDKGRALSLPTRWRSCSSLLLRVGVAWCCRCGVVGRALLTSTFNLLKLIAMTYNSRGGSLVTKASCMGPFVKTDAGARTTNTCRNLKGAFPNTAAPFNVMRMDPGAVAKNSGNSKCDCRRRAVRKFTFARVDNVN